MKPISYYEAKDLDIPVRPKKPKKPSIDGCSSDFKQYAVELEKWELQNDIYTSTTSTYRDVKKNRLEQFWADLREYEANSSINDEMWDMIRFKAWEDQRTSDLYEVHGRVVEVINFVNEMIKAYNK